jgi:tRNA-specific 2-thiouridylase
VGVGADEELMSRELRAERLNWISVAGLAEDEEMRVRVKIRHRHEPAWATLRACSSPAGEDCVIAEFDEAQRAITPGQAAVFYDGDEVVGGGWIV